MARPFSIGRALFRVRLFLAEARASRAGWRYDEDGWLRRPRHLSDRDPRDWNSGNAFVDGRRRQYLYCRDPFQACALDRGRKV